MNIDNITGINNIKINRKFVEYPLNPLFFMLIAAKYFKIFPKHNGYFFILKSFALN